MMPPTASPAIPNLQSSLSDWLDYLMQLHTTAIDMGLARVGQVAQNLDIVQMKPGMVRVVVAGTNGKGSSVAMLSAIMQAAGYQVGCYTSPHLIRFNERAQINGQLLSDQDWIAAFIAVEQARGDISLSFFEFTTLAAVWFFHQQPLDLVILEVGLGGRLDAVNALDNSSCIITAIDLDHQEYLGDNREDIGFEKAGVMRTGCLCVCSDPMPPKRLLDHANKLQVSLRCLGKDFTYQQESNGWRFIDNEQPDDFSWPMPALLGDFQLQNAAGVLAWVTHQSDFSVSRPAIEAGLAGVRHPGRLQSLQWQHQAWLLDVAHNPQSVEQLALWVGQINATHQTKPIAIFAALADKDVKGMMARMAPHIAQWILLDLRPQPRALDPAIMQQLLNQLTSTDKPSLSPISQVVTDASAAVQVARLSGSERVLVFGSFLTVGAILAELPQNG
jgi:dihydrofolate synthase/folylpolyglutamate synthase